MKTKNSATNLLLNSIIFLILALIVYLIYSIFIKINSNSIEIETNNTSNKVSEIIQVEILNGCGIKGVGERFTDFLRNNNVDVVYTGNYKSFDIDKTLVIDRIGNMANAKKIAELLGVKDKYIIQQINEEYFLDVSIIVGGDYYNLIPLK